MTVAIAQCRPAMAGLRLRIVEPEANSPCEADLRRLFRCRGITRRRRSRLRSLPKILATHGDRIVGLVAYECWGDELRVHEIGAAPDLSFSNATVVAQLLHCVELAAIAGGALRVVILPWAAPAAAMLDGLGYYPRARPGRRGVEKGLVRH